MKAHITDILIPFSLSTGCLLPSYFLIAHTTIKSAFADKSA